MDLFYNLNLLSFGYLDLQCRDRNPLGFFKKNTLICVLEDQSKLEKVCNNMRVSK